MTPWRAVTGYPAVTVDPLQYFGEPCIVWRLPAEQVAEQVWAGWDAAEHLASWPDLTHGHLIVACWWAVTQRKGRWTQRWGAWAQQVIPLLWDEHAAGQAPYSTVPLPPTAADVGQRG